MPCVRLGGRRAAPRVGGTARGVDAAIGPGLRRTPSRGFSLLEVLVAFVIMSLVAIALFRLFSGALNNASAADDYSRAVLVAESALADGRGHAAAARRRRNPGSADDGRIAWTTRVAPYSPPGVSPDLERVAETMSTRLYRIVAEVTFAAPSGGQRTYALATTRIGAREVR